MRPPSTPSTRSAESFGPRSRRGGPATLGLVLAAILGTVGGSAPVPAAAQPVDTLHRDASGDFSVALAGDAIISRKLSVFDEPAFLGIRNIVSNATAAFVNLEILLHDYGPDVIPAESSGGTYMRADPAMAGELAWMGFDMVSLANNHTMDFGVGGLRATLRAVDEAGLVVAGAGENLAEARAPGYLETPGGRVAIISVASTFADAMMAGPQRKDVRGRPGLSPIRYSTTYVVPREALEQLRSVREGFGWSGGGDDRLRLGGATFEVGDGYRIETAPREGDVEEITAQVRDAERQANWVIVSSHSHESAGDRDVPADFLVEFARAVIDAGADVFVGHGPHVLRGVEIRDGRPIFYSLGDFIFQNETVLLQPADNYERYGLGPEALPSDFYDRREERSGGGFPADPAYWESVVAETVFRGGELAEIRLHPIELGHGLPRPQRGRPVLAPPDKGREILERVQSLSEAFGTRIEIEDGIGVIRMSEQAPTEGAGGDGRGPDGAGSP